MKLKFGMLAIVNPTKRNLRKKIGLTPIRLGGGGDFAPQFTKNQLLNHVGS